MDGLRGDLSMLFSKYTKVLRMFRQKHGRNGDTDGETREPSEVYIDLEFRDCFRRKM
jgi:hypothetical protein